MIKDDRRASMPRGVHKASYEYGFTIVELLIVIVVIGIIAAITVVGYNGISSRANNVRTVAAVRQYITKINIYYSHNDEYPAMPAGVGGVCLGVGYKDRVGNDGIGDCGESAYPLKEDATYTSTLLDGSAGIVNNVQVKMPYQTSNWVGATIHKYAPDSSRSAEQEREGFTVDKVSQPYYVMYVLNGGNEDCKISSLVKPDETQYGWPKMTSKLDGQSWSWSDGNTTACVISLPS